MSRSIADSVAHAWNEKREIHLGEFPVLIFAEHPCLASFLLGNSSAGDDRWGGGLRLLAGRIHDFSPGPKLFDEIGRAHV